MAGTWTSERFPQFAPAIRRLTEQHRELTDEPLHLAISYGPSRDQQDVFLLEVISGSAAEGVNPDRELFETTFSSAPGFPLGFDGRLHLVLTTPQEFQAAVREGWPSAAEILEALRWGDYEVLYADEVGTQLLGWLRGQLPPEEGSACG